MATDSAAKLRLLAAEIRAEHDRIDRTVLELDAAVTAVGQPDSTRLQLYGAAALLETFYSGIEKALTRIAGATGSMPEGAAWHRQLLDDATLQLPRIRPAVLSEPTARMLEPYLAFRHRFRNLYLFDLDTRLVLPLLAGAPTAWAAASADLDTFAAHLDTLADECDTGT
jgi:hypothetical protein